MSEQRPRPRPQKAEPEPEAVEPEVLEPEVVEPEAVEPEPDPEPAKPSRPATPAALAASRARRIGGRPTGGTGQTGHPAETRDDARAVSLAKPGKPTKPTKPAKPARAKRPAAELPGWLRWMPAAVLSAGALAMAALLVVFSHGVWWAKPSGNALRDQVVASAKTCVAKTNTYVYTHLDQYRTQVHSCTTGALTGQIDKTITSVIKKYAPTLKAKQTAQINRGAIETVAAGGNQWTLVIFGQLSVTNTNYPNGRTDPFAAEVRMEKVHGKWLMSSLQTVATPLS